MPIDLPAEMPSLTPATGLAAYYTVQEALTNAARHSGGTADVSVSISADQDRVSVRILNDGPAEFTGGSGMLGSGQGLRGMRERATEVGGDLVAGPTDTGFVVCLEVPLHSA